MKIRILLLCITTPLGLLVSANQQITIPVVTHPVYPQEICNYGHSNIPVILRTSNNNIYTKSNTAHNQMPMDIAKVLVNKVLTNPTINTILDPNTKFYNQNGVELHKAVYNSETMPHNYNGGTVPNVINNYIIVPPDYVKLNETDFKHDEVAPVNVQNKNNYEFEDKNGNISKNNEVKRRVVLKNNEAHQNNAGNNNIRTGNQKRNKNKSRRQGKRVTEINKAIDNSIHNAHNVKSIKTESDRSRSKKKQIAVSQAVVDDNKENKIHQNNNHPIKIDDKDDSKTSLKRTRKSKINSNVLKAKYNATNSNSQSNLNNTKSASHNLLAPHSINMKEHKKQDIVTNEHDNNNHKVIKNDNSQLQDIEQQILNSFIENIDNRLPRNSKDEAIIRDFRQKFPEVPESIARTMLFFVQDQFQNQFSNNMYYHNHYPLNYDQYLQIPQYSNFGKSNEYSNKGRSKSRRRKHKKRRNKRKRKGHKSKNASQKNSEALTEIVPEIKEIEPEVEYIVTEQPVEVQENAYVTPTELNVFSYETFGEPPKESTTKLNDEIEEYIDNNNPIMIEEIKPDIEDISLDYNIEQTTTPPLGQENVVPIMYDNRLIQDYYPIFTDNADNFVNTKEYHIKNLNDRHYYTTDKNAEIFINTDRRKPEIFFNEEMKIPEKIFKETLPRILKYGTKDQIDQRHTYFDADRESLKNLAIESYQIPSPLQQKQEIENSQALRSEDSEFRSPPGLEFPDFKTKKVDKNTLKSKHQHADSFDEISSFLNNEEKSSTYSDFKTPMYNVRIKPKSEIRRVIIPSKNEKGRNVETVYANSKVAKYGTGRDDSIESTGEKYDDDTQYYSDERTSFVTSKSVGYPDEFW